MVGSRNAGRVGRYGLAWEFEFRVWELRGQGLSIEEIASTVEKSATWVSRIISRRGGLPPRRIPPGSRARKGQHLTSSDREAILAGLAAGYSMRTIAASLGVSPSTISREVARNRDRRLVGAGVDYSPARAQLKAVHRRHRVRPCKLATNARLRDWVQEKLSQQRWSPKLIALMLVEEFPDDVSMRVSHETIYQALYVQAKGGLRRELTTYLRTRRKQRKSRSSTERRGRISDMVNIADRPFDPDDRSVPGHWEGDEIIGKDHKSALVTVVERQTRYAVIIRLPDGHGPEPVARVIAERFGEFPTRMRKSLTWDQGVEMGQHKQITAATKMDVYFCDPHSPWQRGTNENTNGLIRGFFPKGTDFRDVTDEEVAHVEYLINTRPRPTLELQTPADMFEKLLMR